MDLLDYDASSDEDGANDRRSPAKAQEVAARARAAVALPNAASLLHAEVNEADVEVDERGKQRTFKHVDGDWATSAYISGP
jgi:hypothetical protein